MAVIGEIPRDLNGVYLRNGPNRRFDAPGRYHWFDGDGMVHAMSFENGTARYRNRFIRTRALAMEEVDGRAKWTGVLESPRDNPLGTTRGLPFTDTANTDLIYHDGRVLATWYLCGQPMSIDPLSLETLGAEDFLGTLRGDVMAHPSATRPPASSCGSTTAPATAAALRRRGAQRRGEHEVAIDLPGPRLPHDMAITKHYSILMDLPLVRPGRGRRPPGPPQDHVRSDDAVPVRGDPAARPRRRDRWFSAEPCYIYHVVNAWENNAAGRRQIILDVCRVTRPEPVATRPGALAKLRAYLRLDARLHRYVFDLDAGTTTETLLDDANTEFPSIDARRCGRPSRYAYNVHIADTETVLFDGLLRYDRETGSRQDYRFGAGRYGSEAPSPRATEVRPRTTDISSASSPTSGRAVRGADPRRVRPRGWAGGRVLLPQRVPVGFHATWVRADQLRSAS